MKRPKPSKKLGFMKLDVLKGKLVAAARVHAPSEAVPYAFEKRIMACLAAQPFRDSLSLWGGALWRATVPCLAVVILLASASMLISTNNEAANTAESTTVVTATAASDFSQAFEETLFAGVGTTETAEEVW